MPEKPGNVILLGSGETSPSIRKVYHWLFKRLAIPVEAAILETPAGFEPNSAEVAGEIGRFLEAHLPNFKPRISVIPARQRGTAYSPDDPALLGPLYGADVIFMGPGSPTYAVRQLADSAAWYALCACHLLGKHLILASAATLAASACTLPVYEIYKVGEALHWKPGLDFFASYGLSLTLIPHWNNSDGGAELDTSRCYMGEERFERLLALLPDDLTVVGIDEQTALIIDLAAAACRVMGAGRVTLLREGIAQVYRSGERFPADRLGPFQPRPVPNVPRADLERARREVAALQRGRAPATPDSAILAMLQERVKARQSHAWERADQLREQIEAQGWRVMDTPDGPVLEPVDG